MLQIGYLNSKLYNTVRACSLEITKMTSLFACQVRSLILQEALKRAGLDTVDEAIMRNVVPPGLGQNPAQQTAIGALIPMDVPSFTINKVCGSGLKVIMLVAQAMKVAEAEIAAPSGMESMTNAPYVLFKARSGVP